MRVMHAIDEVVRLREKGWTLDAIGAEFGYTRERVRQVISKYQAETGHAVLTPLRETKALELARIRQEARVNRERERESYWASFAGQRFGTLVVADVLREPDFAGELVRKALCRCDCGVVSKVHVRNLTGGLSASCGSKAHHRRGWTRRSAPSNVVHIPEGYL